MQQPYSSFAKTLLERQRYPDLRVYPGGPPKRPYDVTAQTLPLLMGVETQAIESEFSAKLTPARGYSFRLDHQPASTAWAASDVYSWKNVNSELAVGNPVFRDASGDWYPAPGIGRTAVKRPRIGLYRSWMPAMDEGWTRWVLEEFEFAYTSLTNGDVQRGSLRERFDTIVFPDQSVSSILEGYREGTMPPEYTGGIGGPGIAALKDFANAGGTLVFLNHSTEFALDQFGLKVKNVLRGLSNREFYSPGSLLNATLARDPLTYGMPEHVAVWSEGSPAWEVPEGAGRVIARYPASNVLASGWLLGEKHIARKAALVEVPYGKGRIILFGMRPQYRAQSYQGFKMFFNSLMPAR